MQTKLKDTTPQEVQNFVENSQDPKEDINRFARLVTYRAFYEGQQYEHYKYNWDGQPRGNSIDQNDILEEERYRWSGSQSAAYATPTINGQMSGFYIAQTERKPSITFDIATEITDGFTDYLFGHSKFPIITVKTGAENKQIESNENNSYAVFVKSILGNKELMLQLLQAREYAGSYGTVVIVLSGTDELVIDVYEPQWCIPLFADRRRHILAALEIRRPIRKEKVHYKNSAVNAQETKTYDQQIWERRVITTTSDTIYENVPGEGITKNIDNPQKWKLIFSIKHDLGIVPAIWVLNMPDKNHKDGRPDYHQCLNSIDKVNEFSSAIAGSLFANMDPTLILGVSPEDFKGNQVRKGSRHAIVVGKGGSASYLEIDGKGIELAEEERSRMIMRICKRAKYVSLDIDALSGALIKDLSGTALRTLMYEMFSKLDTMRVIWEDIIERIVKISYALANPDEVLSYENISQIPFELIFKWGQYVESAPSEIKTMTDSVSSLTGGMPVLPIKTARNLVAQQYKISEDQIEKDADDEAAEKQNNENQGVDNG